MYFTAKNSEVNIRYALFQNRIGAIIKSMSYSNPRGGEHNCKKYEVSS